MKTESQVLHLLSIQSFQGEADWEIVQLFCQKHHFRLGTFTPSYNNEGLTGSQFLDWYHHGFGCGDVAKISNEAVIISDCDTKIAKICGKISTEGFCEASLTVPVSDLKEMDPEDQFQIHTQLSHQNLEYCRKNFTVMPKFVPKINDRVLIWNQNDTKLGVIRAICPDTNEVELYCWFDYKTKKCAYSMHEKDAVTFHEYHFEPMSIIAQRRLNTELNKYGKVWYDKLHRIEPLEVKVAVGQHYWYINDKMKIVQETEKGTPTSHFRYIAGNYFSKHGEALEYLGKMIELLRDRLTK